MPCIFLDSCNDKVTESFFIKVCQSNKKQQSYCETYLGSKMTKKRPQEWKSTIKQTKRTEP